MCDLWPGKSKSQNVLGKKYRKRSYSDLVETKRDKTITVRECIAADRWQTNPLFISKSSGSSIKCWFNGSEDLSPNTMVWISSNDRVSDISPSQWLDRFIKATAVRNRTKRDENRILIPNSHGSHLPLEILQKRKDHMTVLFELLDNFTHICQPLDCKSFLSYKQHFLGPNHEISYQVDKPMEKV